jgi:hypothetical protein
MSNPKRLSEMTDEELSYASHRGVPLDQAVAAEVQARQANRLGKATENLVTATRRLVYATWAIGLIAVLLTAAQVYLMIRGRR